MKLKRFNNINESEALNEDQGGYILIARYDNNTRPAIKVEDLGDLDDDEDLQDIADEVSQQFGVSVILNRKEAEEVMDKIQDIVRHQAKP